MKKHHLHIVVVDLGVNIQNLNADQGRKSDCDNVYIWVIEHDDGKQDDYTPLNTELVLQVNLPDKLISRSKQQTS